MNWYDSPMYSTSEKNLTSKEMINGLKIKKYRKRYIELC